MINSFLLIYDNLKGEIEFGDLLNLEILRVKYPRIYKILGDGERKWLTMYTDRDKQPYNLRNSYILEEIEIKETRDNTNYMLKETIMEQDLKKNKSLDLAPKKIKDIVYLMRHLFIAQPSPLSIAYPYNFDKYFAYRLLDGDLPETEFSKARRELNNEEFKQKIEEWSENGFTYDFLKRIERFNDVSHFNNIEDFEKIVISVFHLADINKDGMSINVLDRAKLYDLLKIGENLYPSIDEFYLFLEGIYRNALPPFYYKINFLVWFHNTDEARNFPFKLIKQKQILLNYLKIITKKQNTFTNQIAIIYYAIQQKKSESEREIAEKAKEIFINFLKEKDAIGFFKIFATSDYRYSSQGSYYGIRRDNVIYELFSRKDESTNLSTLDTLDNIIKFYKEINTKSPTPQLNEALEFLELYRKNDAKKMRFDFKEIDMTPV